ncbi:MAG: MlaD family protein [Lacunisphaera sp.]
MPAPAPKLSRLPRIQLIWVVPIVALIVAAWMLMREWRSHGAEITIEFADGSGVEPRQTKLEYKGVTVGEVQEIGLAKDLKHVVVRLQLRRDADAIAREGAKFWIVQPEIGFGGISGLDTLLSGAHMGVRLGDGAPAKNFRGLDSPPVQENLAEGRAFILRTDRLGGLQVHAPVFYRDVKVGEVESARLTDDSTGVWIRIRVQTAYAALVRTNTRFWNAGGSPLQISLFGGGSQKKSLQSIITGAVAFATPEAAAEAAEDGTQFPLASDMDKDWLKWSPHIPINAPEQTPEKPATPKVLPGLIGG